MFVYILGMTIIKEILLKVIMGMPIKRQPTASYGNQFHAKAVAGNKKWWAIKSIQTKKATHFMNKYRITV